MAAARVAGLPVTGYDRLGSGSGEMRFRAQITGAVFS